MTLFVTLSRRLSVLALAGALSLPLGAAELDGTVVPVDAAAPVEAQLAAPVPIPEPAPVTPGAPAPDIAPPPDEHQQWTPEHQQQVQEHVERQIQDAERQARDVERQMRDHQNWQRDLEKNLSQAFGKGNSENNDDEEGTTVMEALIVIFSVSAGVIFLCSPLILMGFYLWLRHKGRVRRQQELNNNIDKLLAAGRDIPVELLRGDEPKGPDDSGNLAKGVRNLCLGTGWFVFLTIAFGIKIGAIGFIWVALGTSQVVVWLLNKPKAATSSTEPQAGQQD